MKKELITAGALAVAFIAAPSFANDLEDKCVAYNEENGGDPSGCACLGESAEGDVYEEFMAIESQADLEALSDDAKAVLAACFPNAG